MMGEGLWVCQAPLRLAFRAKEGCGGVLGMKGGKWEAISVKYTICGDVKQMRQEGFAPRRVNEVKQT